MTTDPEEIDNLLRRLRRTMNLRIILNAVRSMTQGGALGMCGYMFGWGLEHGQQIVSVFAAMAGVLTLVSFYLTWYLDR